MDNIDELIIDVALGRNGVKDYYAGRNIQAELNDIAQGEEKIITTQKKLTDSSEKTSKSLKRTAKAFDETKTKGFQLGRALRTLGLYIGVKEVIAYADEWQKVANTLSQITSSDKERLALQEKLYNIGRKTRSKMSTTVDTYTSLGAVGLSQSQQLNATETLQKAFKATGGDERTAETIRRMLKTGKLTTLLGINQSLAEIIASGLNMSLDQLQQKIKKGGLTSLQVLQALSNKSSDIDRSFAKTKTTLAEAFSGLRESAIRLFGTLEEKTGAFSKTAKFIDIVAGWVDVLSDNLSGLFKTLALGVGIAGLGGFLSNFDLLILNMKDGIGVIKSLQLAMSGTWIASFTKALWGLTAPMLKIYLVLEAINQIVKIIKGEDNIFSQLGEMVGNWVSGRGFTLDDETYSQRVERLKREGKVLAKPIKPIQSEQSITGGAVTNNSNTSNKNVTINNNITVNQTGQDYTPVTNAVEASSVKLASMGV
jgi:hypothetical protein